MEFPTIPHHAITKPAYQVDREPAKLMYKFKLAYMEEGGR